MSACKRLDEATQALRRFVELAPQASLVEQRVFAGSCHELGALLIKTGDLEGYRQLRKSVIGRSQTIDTQRSCRNGGGDVPAPAAGGLGREATRCPEETQRICRLPG